MAAWTEDDWNIKADLDIIEESALEATRNSGLEFNVDFSVATARSRDHSAVKRSGRFVDTPPEESGQSLDEDSPLDGNLERDYPAGDGAFTPGLSDISLPPKHTITTDPLDLSWSEDDDAMGQQQRPSNRLPTIPEEPELEAQLEMEHAHERNPEELSTHMAEEPAPLVLDALPIQDRRGLSTEPENDLSLWEGDDAFEQQPRPFIPLPTIMEEPELEAELEIGHPHERNPEELSTHMAEEPAPLVLNELRVQDSGLSIEHGNDVISELSEPELQMSNLSLENQLVRPKSPYQTRNRPQISAHKRTSNVHTPEKPAPPPAEARALPTPLSQQSRLGGHRKPPSVLIDVKDTRPGAGVAPPVMAKGSVGNQFLQKIGQLPRSAVLSEGGHDTYPLAQDLMSIEGAQKQPGILRKEELGKLFNKKPILGAPPSPISQAQSRVETGAQSDDHDEDSSVNFDHLPIRSRIDIWKRREDRAIRKGMILVPKVGKQGRFPISAASP